MTFEVIIEKGDEYGEHDVIIATIENCSEPKKDDILKISVFKDDIWDMKHYLVRGVYRSYVEDKVDKKWKEFIQVYVLPL